MNNRSICHPPAISKRWFLFRERSSPLTPALWRYFVLPFTCVLKRLSMAEARHPVSGSSTSDGRRSGSPIVLLISKSVYVTLRYWRPKSTKQKTKGMAITIAKGSTKMKMRQ